MSDSDKQALLDGTATIPFRITILGETEDDNVVLTEADIVDVTYEDYRYVDTATICIGQFVAREVSGTIVTTNLTTPMENKEIKVEMGVKTDSATTYYSLGNFLVTLPENDDVDDTLDFEAMDYTKKFNQEFDATDLTFPCTALQLAQYCCNKCGVELATTTFANSTFIVPNNQYETGDTYRKVMQDIGKLAYSWIRIGWDNKCYIDFSVPSTTIEDDNKITPHNYYDLTVQNEKFGPVNRVVIGMTDVEGENAYVEDGDSIAANGLCELQIMDCNITYTPELRQQAITGASRLFGLTFVPVEINTTGHPWLLGDELIEIEKTDGTKITTIPFDRTIEYAGHIKTKLVASADTKTETEYKNPGTLENAVKQTRIIVDKQNQTITQVVENVSQYDNRITQVEQDVDSISQQVSQITDLTREVTNTGNISTGEDATTGYPIEFRIYGDVMPVYPANDLYPSDTLFPKPIKYYLTVEYTEDDIVKQDVTKLPFDYLTYLDDIYDEFIIDSECNAKKIKRIGFSSTGQKYVLPEEETINYDKIFINLHEGVNTLSLNYNTPTIYLKYAIQNEFTDIFATKVELSSAITQTSDSIMSEVNKKVDEDEFTTTIEQTSDSIMLEVNKKVDEDNIISSINLSQEEITIQSNKISLEGATTINDNFSIDENGDMSCNNATINGTINGSVFKGMSNDSIKLTIGYTTEDTSTLSDNSLELTRVDGSQILNIYGKYWNTPNLRACQFDSDAVTYTFYGSSGLARVVAGEFSQNSLESTKTNFEKFNNGLSIIVNSDIYRYNLKNKDINDKQIGLVISDCGGDFNTPQEIISEDGKGINLYSMISIAWESIKEQQSLIIELNDKIKELENNYEKNNKLD